jgi:hypothetical protein
MSLDAYFQRPYSLEDYSLGGRLKAGEVAPEGVDVMRYVHPNIEWKSAVIGITSRGYEGTARGVDRLLEAAQDYRVNVQEITDLTWSTSVAVRRAAAEAARDQGSR